MEEKKTASDRMQGRPLTRHPSYRRRNKRGSAAPLDRVTTVKLTAKGRRRSAGLLAANAAPNAQHFDAVPWQPTLL